MEKIAVIGTGASGFGVVNALLALQPAAEITVIDPANSIASSPDISNHKTNHTDFYNQIYNQLFSDFQRVFPPPKTHFGEKIPKSSGQYSDVSLFASSTIGGLTNYWGGTMLPFTDNELHKWPTSFSEMKSHYQAISNSVGIAGGDDRLLNYFKEDFSNRPPIRLIPIMDGLKDTVDSHGVKLDSKIYAGANRICLETRYASKNACVYCGECMAGCYRDSVFSTREAFKNYFDDSTLKLHTGKVESIDPKTKSIDVRSGSKINRLQGFSKIFLCAGCPASTEIVMRSCKITQGPIIADNAVYVFPILRLKGAEKRINDDYLSQCNLILSCELEGHKFAQAQIYPNFDYLWRYNIPPRIFNRFQKFFRLSRDRVAWGRLYLHSDLSQKYIATIDNGEFNLKQKPAANFELVRPVFKALRNAVNHGGYYIPPVRPVLQKTNSHYGSSFPYGGALLPVSDNGEFAPGCYLCDSSVFPDMPAVSPTFTIMANARRSAMRHYLK